MAKAQILIVEDDGAVALDIKICLKNLGYAVPSMVSSGEAAIEKVKIDNPDLVLMDIMLKGEMDGIETAGKIRSEFDIPVVFLSAYADDEILNRAKITEPFGYIVKPFEERGLNTVIEIAIYKNRMERKLKESAEWFSITLKSIGDAVITTDTKSQVTFMNPVAQSLTGWSREEAGEMPLKDVFRIINEKTRKPVEDPVTKVMREGKVVGLANHTLLITKNGAEIPIAASGSPIKDKKGNIIGVVLVFHDIVGLKKMEQELQKIEKLQSVGVLAGGIAHDFNNILTAILGNTNLAEILIKAGNNTDKALDVLSSIERVTMRAKDLAQQLLTFAKGGAPIKKTAHINELIIESTGFALSGTNIIPKFSIPETLWAVDVDGGQVSQVINNLMINAAQAMPTGGIININAENVTETEAKKIPTLEAGKYIKVSVKDHGVGIPKKLLNKIFDPYFTTKQIGSGLGLASSYSIIKNHGGLITVESEQGVDTTFYIYLPASSYTIVEKKCLVEDKPIIGSGKILIMDDNDIIRDMASQTLGFTGYKVECAVDGVEAIEMYKKAEESGEPFDVVIMDLTIRAGMGGKEAIGKLHEIYPEAKAIVSSGYSDDPVMVEFEKHGFKDAVAKPFEIKKMNDVLQGVIKG